MTPGSARRPRIAIAPCEPQKLADYVESVRLAGGDPWVLEPERDRALQIVDRADGLLLPGGGDVHPARYAVAPHQAFSAAEPGRDEYELALASLAVEADTPLLAICRGLQVLNVARGGSLFQHLPEEKPSATRHNVRDTMDAIAHEIEIAHGSVLSRALAHQSPLPVSVNSRHHQAVRDVGEGLAVSATAPDGVVEALEDPSRRFCLGVQWHPENFWRTRGFHMLFEAFVRAAAIRAR